MSRLQTGARMDAQPSPSRKRNIESSESCHKQKRCRLEKSIADSESTYVDDWKVCAYPSVVEPL